MTTDNAFDNLMIRASAGTGKTFQLSNRYLRLITAGVNCREVLATTFTKKGAGEILDRIVNRLADAALDSAAAKTLAADLDMPLTQDQAAETLHSLLRNLNRLEISTLDSFFARVARAFSLELALSPAWEIVDEQQIDQTRQRVIQEILRGPEVETLIHLMTKGESSRRVETLIMDTVKDLYPDHRDIDPEAWDCLPEPRGSLDRAGVNALIEQAEAVETSGRFTKHWATVIEKLDAEDWAGLIGMSSVQRTIEGTPEFYKKPIPDDAITIIRKIIKASQAWVINKLRHQNQATRRLLEQYGGRFEQLKNESGDLRFDDVTQRLADFVGRLDSDQFAFRMDSSIQHLLLDEFQDTSLQQWQVIQPFARLTASTPGSDVSSFFCVGDLKQAIYSWRGGVAEIFDSVTADLPGLVNQDLSTSYRSSPAVITFVNHVFGGLDRYKCGDVTLDAAVHQWQDWFQEHSTALDMAGYVTVEFAEQPSEEDLAREDAKPAQLVNDNVDKAAVARVASLVKTIPTDQTIAILVRVNREVGPLIHELKLLGIDASEEGGSRLTDSAAVELVLSAFQLADHPADSVARFHLSHSPLAEPLGLTPENAKTRAANIEATPGISTMLRQRLIEDGFGPTAEWLAGFLIGDCTARELLRLQHLVRLAWGDGKDSDRWGLRPGRFVQWIRDDESAKVSDPSSARVRVMTIHKAKGLEFDSVILPMHHPSKGWFPSNPKTIIGRDSPTSPVKLMSRCPTTADRLMLPDEFEDTFQAQRRQTVREAMCTLYVAITRAAKSLHVVLPAGEKADAKNSGAVLLSALNLDEDQTEGVVYETGDAKWYEADDSTTDNPAIASDSAEFYVHSRETARRRKLKREPVSMRGVDSVTPSSMEGGGHVRISDLVFDEARAQKRESGNLVHAAFESIEWLDSVAPTDDELQQPMLAVDRDAEAIGVATTVVRRSLEHDNIARLFSLPHQQEQFGGTSLRLEVRKEQPFAVMLDDDLAGGGRLLRGAIDRLVLAFEGDELVAADVIDFQDRRNFRLGDRRPGGLVSAAVVGVPRRGDEDDGSVTRADFDEAGFRSHWARCESGAGADLNGTTGGKAQETEKAASAQSC